MEHSFTATIKIILIKYFNSKADEIFEKSQLVQYINLKTKSAEKGSKSRSSFANLYAIYVLIEDYLNNNFDKTGNYSNYEGALFSNLFKRQRELPFGSKLQNHALNNRMNGEFQKFFPNSSFIPILRNHETNRYWINENLLKISIGKNIYNLSKAIIEILNEYIKSKKSSFDNFIETCNKLQSIEIGKAKEIEDFILGLLAPNIDARLFEIVSYAILKFYYHEQIIYWGYDIENLNQENLTLYKTGRTNANDGGIDFVMKPLGRFFQVTETLDVKKYFLDIDKIQRYPITFVIKSLEDIITLKLHLKENANKYYSIQQIVDKYMNCIEEIINIHVLKERFINTIQQGYLNEILDEIILQSKVEFNYEDEDEINE